MYNVYHVSSGHIMGSLMAQVELSDKTQIAYDKFTSRWGGDECIITKLQFSGLLFGRNAVPQGWEYIGGNVYRPNKDSIADLELSTITPFVNAKQMYQRLGLSDFAHPCGAFFHRDMFANHHEFILYITGPAVINEYDGCQRICQTSYLPSHLIAA